MVNQQLEAFLACDSLFEIAEVKLDSEEVLLAKGVGLELFEVVFIDLSRLPGLYLKLAHELFRSECFQNLESRNIQSEAIVLYELFMKDLLLNAQHFPCLCLIASMICY